MAENKYGLELVSGLAPKNGGEFPLIKAKDVEMPDGTRLSEFKGGGNVTGLPAVTTADNGKTLKVVGGAWTVDHHEKEVPEVTADDNGKIMQVVDGELTVISLADSAVKTYIDDYISSALGGDY